MVASTKDTVANTENTPCYSVRRGEVENLTICLLLTFSLCCENWNIKMHTQHGIRVNPSYQKSKKVESTVLNMEGKGMI